MIALSKKLLPYFCLCLGVWTTQAQYRIDQWTADDGLPQNSIYAIAQTRDGYLWLATVDGLARFDGARFTIFNKSNSPGIVNNRFVSLFEATNRDLWAVTEESGIVRYRQGRFTSYGVEQGLILLNNPRISSDTNGNPLILLSNFQLRRFEDEKFSALDEETVSPPHSSPTSAARPESIPVFCFSDLDKKQMACVVDGRWLRFSLDDHLLFSNIINAVQDFDGTLWLLTKDTGLVHLENGKVVKVYTKQDGLPEIALRLVSGARLSLLSKDRQGALWLTDLKTMRGELLTRQPPTSLNEVYSGYEDTEGNIWLGTFRNGLFRVRKQVVTAYSEADGLKEKNVYPIYEDRAGTIWIGTTSGLFKREYENFSLVESTENFQVGAIGEDPAGRILVSNGGALYVQENKRFVLFERGKISDASGNAIHTDLEKTLWIGGNGLRRFKDGVLTKFTTPDGLAGNDVKVIINARAGGIWIGTYDGLTRMQNGKFTSWRERDGLPSRTVRALYEDRDGTLWIGSYDGGLARFKDEKFTHYDTKSGLPNDGAFQILEDDNGYFWISSNRGIYRVQKYELNEFADGRQTNITAIAYDKSDGMLNAECNGGRSPAGVRARNGQLWFPTQDGAAVIDPREIKVNRQPPPVVIETVKIDNISLQPSAVAENSDLKIKPSQDSFEISYTALSFINSENLRFKYKLEGLDKEWIDAGTRRLAYFSHVPPGTYTFRVIAANSDNIWNEQGAMLKIVVLPPFYLTWWFLILTVFAIAGTAYLLLRRRIAQINLKHTAELAFSRRLIDSQEQERKRFAAEMHDGLGQSLVIIKNRARLSLKQSDQKEAMLDHLENISETASYAIAEAKEIAFNLRPHLLDRLGLTKTIESMLNKAFSASTIKFDTKIDLIDDVLEKNSEILLYRIMQECVNNIVKHSQASKAVLRIERAGRHLTIKISDNGRGFNPTKCDQDLSKLSFGLIGITERTRLLGGKLNIESAIGNGTLISIIIKV